MNQNELTQKNKEYTLASWTAQDNWKPIGMVRAKGIYFWDANDKRYIDWSSQLMLTNIGHGNEYVINAMFEQAKKTPYAYPGIATEPRAKLGELLRSIMPNHMKKTFFTNAGADAIENAMKIARLYTGRQKILTRYRSYHGGTFGAMSAGGDPRRLANEPSLPWIVRFHGPYSYRNPVYRGRTQDEGDLIIADLIEDTVKYEGPENVAALLLEGYSGSSGIMQGGPVFWKRVQEICDDYDILLIIDEVMSGFGRTGKMFAFEHYNIKPDLVTMAKGITSGYIQLGGVTVSSEISEFFNDHVLWCGLTYSAHTLACAGAIANIEVIQKEKLVENSRKMGIFLENKLRALKNAYNCIGEIRGIGLFYIIEIVRDRETREPMSKFNQPLAQEMATIAKKLKELGLSTFVRWNWIFCTPPLIITEAQIEEGIDIIESAIKIIK